MIESNKPIVLYRGSPEIFHSVDQNGNDIRWAMLFALNHPKLGPRKQVRTSLIVHMTDCGIIETLNTIYEPVDEGVL